MKRTYLAPLVALALVPLGLGCSQAKNTPEQAFEALKSALEQERWELLYDILPTKQQQAFDQHIGELDKQLQAASSMGKNDPEAVEYVKSFTQQTRVTVEQWRAMDAKKRFATVFSTDGRGQLMSLGINPDQLLKAVPKEIDERGSKASIVVDDGKGHRRKLLFELEGEYWRFNPVESQAQQGQGG